MSRSIRRRRFIARCAALGAASLAAPRTGSSYPANEALRIGCIGTGGRSRGGLMPAAKKVAGVRLIAVCDVHDKALEEARAIAQAGAPAGEAVLATKDHREILDRKDIDAVIIATPDHWHVPLTIEAVKAGKDVYVEKPLTHKVKEGAAVVAARDETRRIVQVGMQQRSMPQFQKANEIIRSGLLGPIHKVHLTWNRNAVIRKDRPGIEPRSVDWRRFVGAAPEQPFDEYRFRNWRWFWDFGGGILTDLMVHYIDVANWFLDLGHPATASTMGDHFQTQGVWETPDTIQTLLHYPERKVQLYFEGTFSNARNAAMLEFMGTKGTLYLDRGRYEIHPERGQIEYSEFVPGKSGRGADFDQNVDGELLHVTDWIESVRSRRKPSAPAEAGVLAVTGAHLGNLAYRTGKVAKWVDLEG
ncbi:MAG TPA: Gfo/Idh/MocA family oxidoreductase [Planctomycetota bacterium]|nr:Gfo/Idh/MocA family oxidoreductase [Planctomycetota bacterium]